MEKRSERIAKYLGDSMSSEERKRFEEELNSSKELFAEFITLRNRFNNLKSLGKVEEISPYFNNVVPKFRDRLAKDEDNKFVLKLKPATVLGLSSVVIIVGLLLLPKWDSDPKKTDNAEVKKNKVEQTDINGGIKNQSGEKKSLPVADNKAPQVVVSHSEENTNTTTNGVLVEKNSNKTTEISEIDKKIKEFVLNLSEEELKSLYDMVAEPVNL